MKDLSQRLPLRLWQLQKQTTRLEMHLRAHLTRKRQIHLPLAEEGTERREGEGSEAAEEDEEGEVEETAGAGEGGTPERERET
jgi:iron-sulfur cluster repair protein YtfE (RIC family)